MKIANSKRYTLIPTVGRQGQVYPWDLLASQHEEIMSLDRVKDPDLRKQMYKARDEITHKVLVMGRKMYGSSSSELK